MKMMTIRVTESMYLSAIDCDPKINEHATPKSIYLLPAKRPATRGARGCAPCPTASQQRTEFLLGCTKSP